MSEDNLELIKSLSPEKRAMILRALKREAVRAQDPPISRRAARDEAIPLSFQQQRLWLLDQLRPGGYAYNEFAALRLVGVLGVALLDQSIGEIVRRHEALRTTFPSHDGNPVQRIAPMKAIRPMIIDLSRLSAAEGQAELKRCAGWEARQPFDLENGPLLRLVLLRLGGPESALLITAHHIVLDGWSIGIFDRELAELYRAFGGGHPSPLQELPIQYADFAIWQHRMLQDEALGSQLDYWTRQLGGVPPLLQIPVANPRPETESFRGTRHHFRLTAERGGLLKAVGLRESATLFMTLLAGFLALLYRYTGETDIPIGTVVANRARPEVEPIIGFFVNTLVLRSEIVGNASFRQVLSRVHDVAVAAYENKDVPFEHVVDALRPDRSLSYNPLFQVMFILQNAPDRAGAELPELTLAPMVMESVTAKYDLTLLMEDAAEGLMGAWEYNCDLFEPATIMRMSGHLQNLLGAIIADPERRIADLSMLTPSERQQVLVEWNETEIDYPRDECIHRLFEAQAAQSPDSVALEYADRNVSYQELNRCADRVGAMLQRLGIGVEALVGVCLNRSVEMVITLLGVLKAGAAYVPLDPSYPQEWLAYVLEDSRVEALLTDQQLVPRMSGAREKVIRLDTIWDPSADGEQRPASRAVSDNLAYVIYTSGSTGRPKGVSVSQRNLVHSTLARWSYYEKPVSKYLLLSSFAFDSSVAGIYWTLTRGGTLVLSAREDVLDIAEVCRLISCSRVSHLLTIPSVYALILQEAQSQQLESLQNVILAGESCPAQVIEHHRRILGHASVFNEYGPTEASVWSSVHKCDGTRYRVEVPIGEPIDNTQIYLLDSGMQAVPIGIPGELCIGGAGVAGGYLNHPELTAVKFVPDASARAAGTRLYRTGDVARYRADGVIELLGRADRQIKVRGFRVELDEIETVLLRHPGVREAVVAVREDGLGNNSLVGYLVANGSEASSIPEVREFLKEQLPESAVPAQFVELVALPRLPNGKVDRNSLPSPSGRATEQLRRDDWTDLERSIAEIWKETLSIESIDLDRKFFEVGGDSLSAVKVFNRLRGITDKDISITDMFKHQTIRSLAEFLEG